MTPNPDTAGAGDLRRALARIGYDEAAVEELLGEDSWTTALDEADEHDERLPRDALGNVLRLFFLELPLSRREAERALGKRGLAALERTGLADVGEEVEPLARLVPLAGLLIASDRLATDPLSDPPDYVATYSPATRLCDLLTPRPRVERALDVGTGNGVHALLAARHAGNVVATDVNPRALAYTELNAALSGLANVECRRGSLFEPVAGEHFDLIVCNAPYVISPEGRWTYRETAFAGDLLSERVVRDAPAHLADGGLATLCVAWLAGDADAPDERVVGWVQGSGCDAWILPVDELTPHEYGERWNAHLSDDDVAHGEAIERWTSYLGELGAELVTEGVVLLHRREGPTSWRIDEIVEDELEAADEQIRRAFAARARLDGGDLLDATLAPADGLRIEPRRGRRRARVVLDDGTRPELEASPRAAAIAAALDGRRALRELSPSRDAIDLCRDLLELGMVEIVELDRG